MEIKPFPATRTPALYSDLWRLEVQREKLRSAGHWGEGSRSGVVEVGGGGNDWPTADAFEASGGREREVTEGATPHSLTPLPSPAHGPRNLYDNPRILGLPIIFPDLANWLLTHSLEVTRNLLF